MAKLLLVLLLLSPLAQAGKSVTVFVILCDNKSQGIAPVGKMIGNGDDAANNLYWGCTDALKSYFTKSAKWKRTKATKPEDKDILESCEFQHLRGDTTLVAHAYRGTAMKRCLEDFFKATREAGKDELVAFIGHNGLMDTEVDLPAFAKEGDERSSSIVLCCLSKSYFNHRLESYNSRPLLLTSQLMYPGSFLLHDSIEVWRKNGSRAEHRAAAGQAYAKNQKISVRAATGVFAKLE